jgi:hypothetical protein
MLSHHRRYFVLAAFLLLATPLVWGMVLPDSPELILKEGRKPTLSPAARPALRELGCRFPARLMLF